MRKYEWRYKYINEAKQNNKDGTVIKMAIALIVICGVFLWIALMSGK